MRIAALERFDEPSRRCDPRILGGADDDIVVWDLHPLDADQARPWSAVLRSIPEWALLPLPLGRRWRLLRSCLEGRTARRRALEQAPRWARSIRAGEIDEVACYSTKGFPLASALAEMTGRPCREFLAESTRYFGEFAFEMLAVIPYAYWLHQQGRLRSTASTPDTRCLYYFSPDHREEPVDRRYLPITEYPVGEAAPKGFDQVAFPRVLDTSRWSPPPYRAVYRDDRFRWPKPAVVVCNKASDERYLNRGFALNYLDTDLLLELVGRLRERYTVIYNRPRASDIVTDDSETRDLGDIEAVKAAFPDVVTIQELHARHPELGFNELQLRVFASCDRFVSVLGGSSYLASYFGGVNVVYAQQGWEVDCNAFENWFDRFSGARVIAAASRAELLTTVERELLGVPAAREGLAE